MNTYTSNREPSGVIAKILSQKGAFLTAFFCVFLISVGGLSAADLLPNPPGVSTATLDAVAQTEATPSVTSIGELPLSIEIPKLSLTATVANPGTTDATVLDRALLEGAVRYPTSGTLGVTGTNVVLFGHSSYLPIVHNQAYKTFDGIQNLKPGDQIVVRSNTKTYVYAVATVAQANAQTDGIPVAVAGQELTLVTCDSFATKSDRYVVIAQLVESYPSGS